MSDCVNEKELETITLDDNCIAEVQDESVSCDGACAESDEGAPVNDKEETSFQNEINRLSDGIAALEKLFKAKILHTAHEEKIVDKMHSELQKYKEDMYAQLVRPILLDMIEVRDSILRVADVHHLKAQEEQYIPLDTFEMYAFDVQEILEKNNIEIFKSDKNTDFIPIRQRIIEKRPTADQALHGKIAVSLSDGYSYLGKIISAEKIAAYVYETQTMEAELNNEEEVKDG